MIYLHKIIPDLLSPIFIITLMIMFGGYKRSRAICISAAFILYLSSIPFFANNLFRYVENYSFRFNVNDIPKAEAIVVLSGMLNLSPSYDGETTEWADPDRFIGGIDLYNAKKADSLIFTRGKSPWGNRIQIEGEFTRLAAISIGVPENAIKLTRTVENTQDEAIAVGDLFKSNNPEIILVTSAYHMDRAKYLFEKQNFKVIPFPVDFKTSQATHINVLDFIPDPSSVSLSNIAVRELLGRLYYKVLFFCSQSVTS